MNTADGTKRWSVRRGESGCSRLCATTLASWLATCLSWYGELDVAEREDPVDGGALLVVDHDPAVAGRRAMPGLARSSRSPLGMRPAATSSTSPRTTRAVGQLERDLRRSPRGGGDLLAEVDVPAVARQAR